MKRIAVMGVACALMLFAGGASAEPGRQPLAGIPGASMPDGGVAPVTSDQPRFLQIELPVADLDRALAFYKVLGMHERWRLDRPGGFTEVFIGYDNAPFSTLINLSHGAPSSAQPPAKSHISVVIKDIKAMVARAKAAGGKIVREPRNIGGFGGVSENWIGFVEDPDGNTLELMELHAAPSAPVAAATEIDKSCGGSQTVNTEQNRATALKMVASLGGGMPDLSLATSDATWWAPGRGTYTNAAFADIAKSFTVMFKAPSKITVHGVTAEGDRVAIEAVGYAELTNGKIYNNHYHYLFVFRDGKICEAKLYNDTKHAADLQKVD